MAFAPPSFQPLLLLVSGPAGSGKTTVCEGVLRKFKDPKTGPYSRGMKRVITATTREPRDNEVDGVDYYFFSKAEFRRRVEEGAFYEHAEVYQNLYGTLKSEIHQGLDSGQDLVLNIDVQGAATFREAAARESRLDGRLVTVFLTPPGTGVLRSRLLRRGQNDPDDLEHRLEIASREMKQQVHYDYTIPSGSPEQDLEALSCIFVAEKLKSSTT